MHNPKHHIATINNADDIINFQERLKEAVRRMHETPQVFEVIEEKPPQYTIVPPTLKQEKQKGKPTNITPKKKKRR